MARVHGILLVIAIGLVAHSDGVPANYMLALSRMLRGELAGKPAGPAWHVLVVNMVNGFSVCSGSIISPYWALTAAHCVYRAKPEETVLIATSSLSGIINPDPDAIRMLSSYQLHDNFDAYTRSHDIAVMRVSMPFTGIQKPIAIATEPLKPGTEGKVRQICITAGGSDVVHISKRKVLPQKECEEMYEVNMPLAMACAAACEKEERQGQEEPAPGGVGQETLCAAEAGSALLAAGAEEKLLAVRTWAVHWNRPARAAGVYVDVAAVHDWIKTTCGL